MYCVKCGIQLNDGVNFCPKCGTRVGESNAQQTAQDFVNKAGDFANKAGEHINRFMDTPDQTGAFSQQEVESGKGLAILAYLGPLVFIPFFAEKNNRYVRYHSIQGMYLFIAMVAASIIGGIMYGVFWYAYGIARMINSLIYAADVVFVVIGIVNAASGKARELPLIGRMVKLGWFK